MTGPVHSGWFASEVSSSVLARGITHLRPEMGAPAGGCSWPGSTFHPAADQERKQRGCVEKSVGEMQDAELPSGWVSPSLLR